MYTTHEKIENKNLKISLLNNGIKKYLEITQQKICKTSALKTA